MRQVLTPSLKAGEFKSAIRHHQSFTGWVWEILWLYPFPNLFFLCKDRSHQGVTLSSLPRFLPTRRAELLTPAAAEPSLIPVSLPDLWICQYQQINTSEQPQSSQIKIEKHVQKLADWMHTTKIMKICLETMWDLLPITYAFSRCLLNMFSPHQWIFGTDASCCNSNKRTDGCESCCSYAKELICMQICVAVYITEVFHNYPLLLQFTIKILKSWVFFILPEAVMNIEHMNFPVSPSPSSLQKWNLDHKRESKHATRASPLLHPTMLSNCASNAKIRRKQ